MSELKPTFNVAVTVDLDGDDDAKTQTGDVEFELRSSLDRMATDRLIIDYTLTLEAS